jgi:hypothetical protein
MDRRYIQTMGNVSLHENLRDNVVTANNFATFKNVIEKSKIFHSNITTNTLGLLMRRLRIRFITP